MPGWFPENVSTFGGDIDSLYSLIFYIVALWFVLCELAVFYFLFRYRRKEGRSASYITGESLKQAAWILVPAAIVLVLDLTIDFAGAHAYDQVKSEIPETRFAVQVTGAQFNWNMTYPGPDGALGTEDDFSIENELHVPVNTPIRVVLQSEDVLHSFFVPVLRLKQDVVPGRVIEAWFEATKTGEYEIACAELCGYGHYTMRGFLFVHTPEDYEQWLNELAAAR